MMQTHVLDFLPFHFLLCGVGLKGRLVYFDVSMGRAMATRYTELGTCDVMTHNPKNAVIHCGHTNGTVTLWVPSNKEPVARILCHKSRIRSVAVTHNGFEMATSDDRGVLKIWDLRTYREMCYYRSNSMVSNLAFSQRVCVLVTVIRIFVAS